MNSQKLTSYKNSLYLFFDFLSFVFLYKYFLLIFLLLGVFISVYSSYDKLSYYKLNSTINLNSNAAIYFDNLDELINSQLKSRHNIYIKTNTNSLFVFLAENKTINNYLLSNYDKYDFSISKNDFFSRKNIRFTNTNNSIVIESTIYGVEDANTALKFLEESLQQITYDYSFEITEKINNFVVLYENDYKQKFKSINDILKNTKIQLIDKLKISLKIAEKINQTKHSGGLSLCSSSPSEGTILLQEKIKILSKTPQLCSHTDDHNVTNKKILIDNKNNFNSILTNFRKNFTEDNYFIHNHVLTKNTNFSQSLIRYIISGIIISLFIFLSFLFLLFNYNNYKKNKLTQ